MHSFWDFVIDDAGPYVAGVLALTLTAWVIAMVVGGMVDLGKWFTVDTYRLFKYERHGVCGVCHQRYSSYRSAVTEQMYGPDVVIQGVCPNGHLSIIAGNRRGADW